MKRRAVVFAWLTGALAFLALGGLALWRDARTPPRIDPLALALLERNHRLMTSATTLSGEITAMYSASAGPLRRRVWLEKPNRARIVLQDRIRDHDTGKWLNSYEASVAEIKISDGAKVKLYKKRPGRPYARISTEPADPHGAGLLPFDAMPLFGFFDSAETHWGRIEGGRLRDLDSVRRGGQEQTCDGVLCQSVTYRTSLKPTPVPLLDVALGRASWRAFRSARNPPPSAYSKEVTLFIDARGLIRRAITRDTDPYVSGTIVRTEETRHLQVDAPVPAGVFRFPAQLKPGQTE